MPTLRAASTASEPIQTVSLRSRRPAEMTPERSSTHRLMQRAYLGHNPRMLTPATYRDRRARLSKAIGSGLVLFLANDEVGMNYAANVYPFRQDSSFLYFWALDQPGLAAVIDIDGRTETIFGDDITVADAGRAGPQPPIKSRAAEAGVKKTVASNKLTDVIQAAMKKKRPVHFLAPYRAEHIVKLAAFTGLKLDKLRDKRSVAFHTAVAAQRL